MAINSYFNPGGLEGGQSEKDLLHDLHEEMIQIHGFNAYYLPRTNGNLDEFYLEDSSVSYNSAVLIEMYLKSFMGFQGDGDFMSNMGVEIRDQVVFTVHRQRFDEELGANTAHGLIRPNEGDLVWYPFNQKLFEIKYVDKFSMHYPLGDLYVWDLKCELMEYSGQIIDTGIPEIDAVGGQTMDLFRWAITDEEGNPIRFEDGSYWVQDDYESADPLDDTDLIKNEAEPLLNFDELDIWTEERYGIRR